MNAEDLRALAHLLVETQAVVQQLQQIASLIVPTADPAELLAQLQDLREAVSRLTFAVQDREARSWGRDRQPRHAAPPRLRSKTLPLSTDVPHGIHVRRYDMQGQPSGERSDRPETTGMWGHHRSVARRSR